MESSPAFPSNKRHAMHFHHQSPPTHEFITSRFPNPKVGHLSPSNVSIPTYNTPETIDEAFAIAAAALPPALHHSKNISNVSQSRQPLQDSQSSNWWMEIHKYPTSRQEPRSRKTDYGTVVTDATETQPAFESDRFAIQMPTTREPIPEAPVFRAKLPSPSKAQVEAYQTYKAKAQQVRETNHKDGVRVPSKIVSYEYAYNVNGGYAQPQEMHINPPTSPPQFEAAGAFPISPPLPQNGWDSQPKQKERYHAHPQGPRSMSDSTHINISRKPVGLGNIRSNNRQVYQRGDASSGAAHQYTFSSSSTSPDTIKVRIKPSVTTVKMKEDSPQKESWWGLYNRSPQSSTDILRATSPTKSSSSPTKPHFSYTNVPTQVWGHDINSITGTRAPTPLDPKTKLNEENRKDVVKDPKPSRWAWLRPTGPRVSKPTSTTSPEKARTYIDPFIQHATPVATSPNTPAVSRPSSPRKAIQLRPPPILAATTPKGKFELGFAQVTSLTALLIKVCLVIYLLVGIYFVMDAIREAVHALGAPFRTVKMVGRYVWTGAALVAKYAGRGWERWGVNIALKGGWRGRWW